VLLLGLNQPGVSINPASAVMEFHNEQLGSSPHTTHSHHNHAHPMNLMQQVI
jgi:hypothetical protein